MRPLRRFFHLERSRRPADDAPPNADEGRARRFSGIGDGGDKPPAPPAGPSASETALARFEGLDAPDDSSRLPSPSRYAYVPCLECRAESGGSAAACFNCGASLTTPAQRKHHASFWVEERERLARAEALSAERRQKELDEAFAEGRRRVEERERLLESLRRSPTGDEDVRSVGLWLVRRFRNPVARLAALVALASAPILVHVVFRDLSATWFTLLLVAALFLPWRRRESIF